MYYTRMHRRRRHVQCATVGFSRPRFQCASLPACIRVCLGVSADRGEKFCAAYLCISAMSCRDSGVRVGRGLQGRWCSGRGMRWLLPRSLNTDPSLESFIVDHGLKSRSAMKLSFHSYKAKRPIGILRLLHRKCSFQVGYFPSRFIVGKEIKNSYTFFYFTLKLYLLPPNPAALSTCLCCVCLNPVPACTRTFINIQIRKYVYAHTGVRYGRIRVVRTYHKGKNIVTTCIAYNKKNIVLFITRARRCLPDLCAFRARKQSGRRRKPPTE